MLAPFNVCIITVSNKVVIKTGIHYSLEDLPECAPTQVSYLYIHFNNTNTLSGT